MAEEKKDNPGLVKEQSRIIIQFAFVGAADFQMFPENVTPAQMLSAASWLEWHAKQLFAIAQAQQMQQQVAVARLKPDTLRTVH